jgi:formylglycine-generating enzyme required for sulfatase activity
MGAQNNRIKQYAGDTGSNTFDECVWYSVTAGNSTRAVKTKKANELGIFDLSGNVSEWCWDAWDYSTDAKLYDVTGLVTDYRGPGTVVGTHVLRGGDYLMNSAACHVGYRSSESVQRRDNMYGFRVVRIAD